MHDRLAVAYGGALQSNRRNRPDDILDAAEQCLETTGFEALSMRRLAAEVGASRQVVYTHFGGRQGLMDALHIRGSGRLARDIAAVDAAPGTLEHVLGGSAAYLRAARSRPRTFQLVFGEPVPGYEPGELARTEARRAFAGIVWSAGCWLAERAGRQLPDAEATWTESEAVRLARVLWAMCHGHAVLEAAGHAGPDQTDRLSETGVRALLAGW